MAFPTTSVFDNFNRSNEHPLASGWQKATVSGTDCNLDSNQVSDAGVGFGETIYTSANYNPATGGGIELFYDIAALGFSGRFGLSFYTVASAPSDTNNGYQIDVNRPSSVWRVKRQTAGSNTTVGTDFTQAISAGDGVGVVIRVSGSDTVVDVYYRSGAGSFTLLGSRTDTGFTTYAVAGYLGFYVENFADAMDNFGGGQVVGGLTAAQMRPSFAQATEASNVMIGRVWD